MASSSTSTSDSPNNDYKFDIFISHRGPDVKETLATDLYHRLCKHDLQVFLDKPEMRAGEYITPQIESAIRTSTVQLVIFSPNYANSKWCLDELVLMVECMSNYKSTIIPVFYGVDPAALRWVEGGRGVYAQALCELEEKKNVDGQQRYESEEIKKWKTALSAVAEIKGFEEKPYNSVTTGVLQCLQTVFELCNLPFVFKAEQLRKDVVQAVLEKVKRRLYVSEYPKGLEEKLTDFETTMSLQQADMEVRVIGIAGLGGVGKTTLAKEFFNTQTSKYKRCCFLFDIRDKPLTTLQSDLLKKLIQSNEQIRNIDEGIGKLQRYLPSSDCLIIFDDVDDIKQLEALLLPAKDALKSNSLILVTSRNKDVLSSRIQDSSIYTLTGLDAPHSKELFCSHAFGQHHPAAGFDEVVNKFVDSCRGLPLSLKVLGSLLRGKNDLDHWEAQFLKISEMLPNDIQGRLQISYDCLDEEEKKIFLDITCFFRGENRDRVIRILNRTGWKGSLGLWKLENRCLVEVDSENLLRMHDHVRDMGRCLAEKQSPDGELRLWNLTDNLFDKLSGESPVRGISMGYGNEGEQFLENLEQSLENLPEPARTLLLSNMSRLQLLKAQGCFVERLFNVCQQLPDLIYLHWQNCVNSSLPCSIQTKNLRVLHIQGNILKTLWQQESQETLQLRELYINAPLMNVQDFIGNMQHLEKLVLWNSDLETVPDELFDKQALKHVEFQHCTKMKLLPDRVVKLKGLQSMIFSKCYSLQKIPDWVGNLGLQHLHLSGCDDLQTLPDSIGDLAGLQHLELSLCSALQTLPHSIGNLAGLQHLDLTSCSVLQTLPDSIGNLAGLQHLNLDSCYALQTLPHSIGNLAGLQHLSLSSCSALQTLPHSIGNLAGLQHLNLSLCSALQTLPHSIGNLAGLQVLHLLECSLQRLPDSIGNLAGLQHLGLRGCSALQRVPDSIGNLAGLQYLSLSYCSALQRLPDSIGNLAGLQHLDLSQCFSLQTLPDSIGNLAGLQHLDLTHCACLQKLPDSIGNLAGLQYLDLTRCSALQRLPDSIGNLAGLQHLCLFWCSALQTLPDSIGKLTSLRSLDLNGCSTLQSLPDSIGGLRNLQTLVLGYCSNLEMVPNVEHLSSLERLYMFQCDKVQWGGGVVEQLRQRLGEGFIEKI